MQNPPTGRGRETLEALRWRLAERRDRITATREELAATRARLGRRRVAGVGLPELLIGLSAAVLAGGIVIAAAKSRSAWTNGFVLESPLPDLPVGTACVVRNERCGNGCCAHAICDGAADLWHPSSPDPTCRTATAGGDDVELPARGRRVVIAIERPGPR